MNVRVDDEFWVVPVECECECEPVRHIERPVVKHQHKEAEVKAEKDVEKVAPVKEAEQQSAPDVTVKLTKEMVAELDAKDGHSTDFITIKMMNSSEVNSQERDLATASASLYDDSQALDSTTFILPQVILQENRSSDGSSSSFNLIFGSEGADTLIGTVGRDWVLAFAGNDDITTLAGDDVIDGGAGADVMRGGAGNDNYFVDNPADSVIENPNAGVDQVITSVSFILPDNVENLSAIFAIGSVNLTGNNDPNIINGNLGSNLIDGRGGADTMAGGLGNDIYIVDNVNDVVIELPGAGVDVIFSSVSFVLPDYVEQLVAQGGVTSISLTGNNDANFLAGNQGDNTLIGSGGADTFSFQFDLAGGFGNDKVNDFTVMQGDVLSFSDVVDSGAPGLDINDVIAMETAPVSHPNGTDTQFTFAAGTVTLVGVNVSDLNDPAIAAQVQVLA